MSQQSLRARGLSAAGLGLSALFLMASCGEPPSLPNNEPGAPGVPRFSLSSEFDAYQFLGFVLDDQGANDVPAQSDLNAFTRADNVAGKIGVKWVWDDVNAWTGSGQTGDACALFDTDGDAKANAAVCVRISNPDGDPSVIAQLPAPASPLIYSCGDSKADRCGQPTTPAPLSGTICEVEKIAGETFFAAGEDGADVLAACSIPLAAISANTTPNLLNVCSFPSGSPNSNPFDCVVTPGAGFFIIKKATTPQSSGATFAFTISPTPAGGANHNLTDNTGSDEQTGLLSAAPGSYNVTEGTLPTGWELSDAACLRQTSPNPTPTGTKTSTGVTGASITSGETTVCTFTNIVSAPSIAVVKTAGSATLAETGGSVGYTVTVTNNSTIAVTLTSLIDDKFGDLDGQGDCNSASNPTNPYGSIAAGGTYSCTFTGTIAAGEAGQNHINEVTASATSSGGPATATDTAKVTFTDVLPDISVSKSADITTITAQGGTSVANFAPDQSFARGAGGNSNDPVFSGSTCDDAGPNDQPDQVDMNCFSRADNVAGRLFLRWTWDDINAWTGSGQTGDACALLDTDNNSRANFAFCVRITNPGGDPTVIAQVAGSPILYKCKDAANSGEIDRCASKVLVQSIDATTVCTVGQVAEHFLGQGDDGFDIQAQCNLRLLDLGANLSASDIDLLNVCSFPSGSPNSNPFDCVVTPQAGFLVITKATTPANADGYFGFQLRNAANTANVTATNGWDEIAVQGGATSAGIPILPGTYAVKELMPSGWSLDGIACTRNGASIGSTSGDSQTGVTIVQGQTTTCTFTNSLVASATVTFTVVVTNNSLEAVTLFSLEDTENPTAGTPTYSTLNGVGGCVTGGSIAGNGGTYTCSFTRTVSGAVGTVHRDRVRAVGKDNENNSDTETSNLVTVSIVQQ